MLHEYVPAPHLAEAKEPAEWETAIFHRHQMSNTQLPEDTYVNVVRQREYFGSTLFVVKVRQRHWSPVASTPHVAPPISLLQQEFTKKIPKKLFLGVGKDGVSLYRIPASFTEKDMVRLAVLLLSS